MKKRNALILTGISTFFFGFGAGAILNLYLIAINSPLVASLRSSLSFKSSIYGDGILLPIVNMIMVGFLYKKSELINKKNLGQGFFGGVLITAWFHVNQAINGLVNWTMPTPWNWNALGLWHAVYMFAVTSLISLFVIISVVSFKRDKNIEKEIVFVLLGLIAFLILLRLDYATFDLKNLIPG